MALTGTDLEHFIRRWYELWNEQDKLGWLQHWKDAAPGKPTLEDPVGTPVKRGWELAEELWDRTGPNHPAVLIEQLIIGGSEAVVVCHNEGTYHGEPLIIPSVDVWRLNADGTSAVRSFWEIPDHIPYGKWTAKTGSAPTS
jgi:hypothetical protein